MTHRVTRVGFPSLSFRAKNTNNSKIRFFLVGSVAFLSLLLLNNKSLGQVKSEYDKFDDQTSLSMNIVIIGSEEKPELELTIYEHFHGKTITKQPEEFDLMFIRSRLTWNSEIKLKLFVDGERLDPITGGPVSGGNHPYYAHFDIPWSKAKKIAYANTVEGKVEEKEFELNYAQLAPLREFLRLVTP